ncbi:acryloyl-CoA reductase [Corynebacterium minutissimum]|uniref:Alcohol dehydrogenase n=1 Tax=Corynebacterium minutissimum TaxID=38301 RepID=A0A376D4B1_9CORY|nr:acryloyl-CoA reductase [Corynebacterium minutissimum]QRP61972.1 acryloyl-CoA reductase [Corynebacterium minutissimum]STC81815.1 alcohol dehydrogenase [Corynebacterium minutissimum]
MSTLIVTRTESGVSQTFQDEQVLAEGDTLVNVQYSSLNYKDAMALEGDKGVMRIDPLVPGIDVVGTVEETTDERLKPGQLVAAFGDGLGEFRHGGYTTQQRVNGEATIPVPERFSAHDAAAIGTAGYTAAICVNQLRTHGTTEGHILVTGATGGVGSIAVQLLKSAGYEVTAVTGRVDSQSEYLTRLGADHILDRAALSETGRPLQKALYDGAIDTAGSTVLANVLAQVRWGGVVAATGMAAGPDLPASVLPFILRGIVLAGGNSVDAPRAVREAAWQLLDDHLDLDLLHSITETVPLDAVATAAKELRAGTRHGRTVVEI